MAQLRQNIRIRLREIRDHRHRPEDASLSRTGGTNHTNPFIGLPDPDHSVSTLYGQEVKIFQLGRMPAQLINRQKRLIRYKHYGNSMADSAEKQQNTSPSSMN